MQFTCSPVQNNIDSNQGHLLSNRIDEVEQSSTVEIKGFTKGLQGDYQAVVSAFTLPGCKGQMDGQISKRGNDQTAGVWQAV